MTQEITFQGIPGKIIDRSAHGNYLVLSLSRSVTICGTFSNKWNWIETPDISSGFSSFITYLGLETEEEIHLSKKNIASWLKSKDARIDFFGDKYYRRSKRSATPFEMKIRELDAADIPELIAISGGIKCF